MMGFRGAALDQAPGYKDADKKLIKSMAKEGRFPKHFSEKVDIKKVSMDVMKPWISKRVTELLGCEDEMVVEYCNSLLTNGGGKLDPKHMQVQMTGFLARKTPTFMSELWELLLSAQENPAGVPQQYVFISFRFLLFLSREAAPFPCASRICSSMLVLIIIRRAQ